MHEAQTFPDSYFLTLTLSDEYMQARGHTSLDKKDLQKFFKRLRHHRQGVLSVYDTEKQKLVKPIRYYACGEYGEQTERAHYHACVFNIEIPDKTFYKFSGDYRLYTSEWLQSLWHCPDFKMDMGHVIIGSVTFDSAAYCARYMLKKQKGKTKEIMKIRDDTGEVLEHEFTVMSRRPGLGRYWFDKYKDDVFPRDFILVNGKKTSVPRTYDDYLKRIDELEFDNIKGQRELKALEHIDNNTPERLKVREACAVARLKNLDRPIE